MNIDRHNYEEQFILYWDNELTAAQKKAVEDFVKENSDLQEEFNLLGETRFTPDSNVQFEEKKFLHNDSFINITNYEEQLLDYIDDELTDSERKTVEKFAAGNSTIKKELALLQRTKLQPEAIVFPDKSALYKREEKVRVISMTWFRVAVAAALILIAGFATIRIVNSNKSSDKLEVASNTNPPVNNATPSNQGTEKEEIKQQDATNAEKSLASTTSPQQEKGDPKKTTEDKIANDIIAFTKTDETNNLPVEGNRTNKSTDISKTSDETITPSFASLPSKEKYTAQTTELEKTNVSFDKSFVTNTSRITSDDIDVPDDIDGASKEKGGLKQFLRKTTRVFERRTKIQATTDDNKLLLGAFAVSLK